ncbi:MAG: ribonuclease Y [Deltaproteobacteria bacterium]|nr:ribonuclease Y [Deltaproteobacteria bacterium]
MNTINTISFVVALVVGLVGGFLLRVFAARRRVEAADMEAKRLVADATMQIDRQRREAELEAKARELKAREVQEKERQEKQRELLELEKRLLSREEGLEKRFELLNGRENEIKRSEQSAADRRKALEERDQTLQRTIEEARQKLEQVGGLTVQEAKKELIESVTEEARLEAAKLLRQIDEETKTESERRAQHIIALSIERMASDTVSERSVSTVPLPNEEMKGRIIGREGRNIRALEAITGVEIVIDDSPDTVSISCFNPIRREIARRTLTELLRDGRIHPARIEEAVAKMTKDVNASIKEAGEQAVLELGLHRVHPELVKLMGALKYRYSYAQNVLQHSIDVGFLCGMMAVELGMSQKLARRAGFLHDVGKAVTHEVEGSHALIGMDLCRKYGERDDIYHAVGAHHEDIQQDTALDCLVAASDALSGARPGARREVLETYMKRLEDLEKVTTDFKGVEKAYAIQAGREIRVMVKHHEVNDAQAVLLSKDIARKIEADLTYPGQIKVTVIRETRAVEYAK